jgi:signal peptidase I
MSWPTFRFRLATLLVAVAILAVCMGWYVNRVLRRPDYKIMHVGGSRAMAPTITREYLAVDVNAYRLAKPARWDAVVLDPREQATGAYVAEVLRVIGLPGETVAFSRGQILINGQPVTPPERLRNITYHADVPGAKAEFAEHPYTVPAGHYYLLGDNPDEANDSRIRGAFTEADIRGRVPR